MARGLAQHGGWCGLQHVHLSEPERERAIALPLDAPLSISPGLTIFCSLTLSVVYLDSKPSDHTICCLSCLLPVTRQRLPLPTVRRVLVS
ncbi:BQ5605_C008g05245 [Microbotryum silenes-dioicae]|uniref:BQ5605_C008g05245 protein n=1 Tax=Microbotryum silenes-dioicae TaxID=796604 RepID=A0A2X0MZK3_9BASI|nr:BQ5605_C008g05245 [Microbotryum silenes-dioicae]